MVDLNRNEIISCCDSISTDIRWMSGREHASKILPVLASIVNDMSNDVPVELKLVDDLKEAITYYNQFASTHELIRKTMGEL